MLIFGMTETGKTTRLIKELEEKPRVVLVDGKLAGLTRLRGYDHIYHDGARGWPEVIEYLRRVRYSPALGSYGNFRVVLHFRAGHREALESLCLLLMSVKFLTLAVDELSLFLPQGTLSAGADRWPATKSVVISGRHDGLEFWGTAQRPALVDATARAQAHRMLFYRVALPNDLDALAEYLPAELEAGRPARETIAALPKGVCVDWRDDGRVWIDHSYAGKLAGVLPES